MEGFDLTSKRKIRRTSSNFRETKWTSIHAWRSKRDWWRTHWFLWTTCQT